MQSVREIIGRARTTEECRVEQPTGLPTIPDGFALPADVAEFYSLCGGLDMFPEEDWGWRIVAPGEFLRADAQVLAQYFDEHPEEFDGTPSEGLQVIAIRGAGPDIVSIDIHPDRLGLCFDSYYGDHATDSSRIVALSFTELLNGFFGWREDGNFWDDSFHGFFGQAPWSEPGKDPKLAGRKLP